MLVKIGFYRGIQADITFAHLHMALHTEWKETCWRCIDSRMIKSYENLMHGEVLSSLGVKFIEGEIVLKKLQNFWVSKVPVISYILQVCKML